MAKPKYKIWQNKSDDNTLVIEVEQKDRNLENIKAMLDEFESRGWIMSKGTSMWYRFKRKKQKGTEPCETSSK